MKVKLSLAANDLKSVSDYHQIHKDDDEPTISATFGNIFSDLMNQSGHKNTEVGEKALPVKTNSPWINKLGELHTSCVVMKDLVNDRATGSQVSYPEGLVFIDTNGFITDLSQRIVFSIGEKILIKNKNGGFFQGEISGINIGEYVTYRVRATTLAEPIEFDAEATSILPSNINEIDIPSRIELSYIRMISLDLNVSGECARHIFNSCVWRLALVCRIYEVKTSTSLEYDSVIVLRRLHEIILRTVRHMLSLRNDTKDC